MTRPEINVRETRPGDAFYDRNEYLAWWIEDGDEEEFPDTPIDQINGCYGSTAEEALERANQHLDIQEANRAARNS